MGVHKEHKHFFVMKHLLIMMTILNVSKFGLVFERLSILGFFLLIWGMKVNFALSFELLLGDKSIAGFQPGETRRICGFRNNLLIGKILSIEPKQTESFSFSGFDHIELVSLNHYKSNKIGWLIHYILTSWTGTMFYEQGFDAKCIHTSCLSKIRVRIIYFLMTKSPFKRQKDVILYVFTFVDGKLYFEHFLISCPQVKL